VIDKSAIDPNALHFYRMLKEAGFSAYFVGGSVRDLLLGKTPKDFDIATNATPHQIKRVIPQGRIIGRRFRHVMLEKSGGRYEIVTFRGPVVQEDQQAELDDEALEDHPISQPEEGAAPNGNERPRKNYPDLNQFGNAEQDALRRDFTINALFYDPDADELVDYVQGKLDIDRKIIRSIGEAAQRMEEDPIRILRAIRHKMKLGLEYDSSLESAMREKAVLLEQTSKDRIREEFLKVCNDHSLGAFLTEARRLSLTPHIMPWFDGITEERWELGLRLWTQLQKTPPEERSASDLGLALMLVPLIEPLVLEPYRTTLKEGEKNYLPDMKYFLSCEPLRNFYLRNLRISRAQTDHIVRALFYYSRMSGLWLEQGPPRRIVGRLFQHPPALLAGKMAKLALELEGKEVPAWILELAEFDPSARRRHHRDEERGPREGREDSRGHRHERHPRNDRSEEAQAGAEGEETDTENPEEGERGQAEPQAARSNRLPPPDKPMVWNGPLHAPVLRPHFEEEVTMRWARKNQTVRAYRPSGIPNSPTDHAFLKSNLVYNYKPEIDANGPRPPQEENAGGGEGRGGRGRRDRGRGRGRGRDRGSERGSERGNDRNGERNRGGQQHGRQQADRQDRVEQRPEPARDAQDSEEFQDEDSIGNVRLPGERPAPLSGMDDNNNFFPAEDEDEDDNIGNRLDGPPTSGHVGVNGEGAAPQQNRSHGRDSGGGSGGNRRRRGRRRGRRGGGGGGQNRGHHRGHHDNA
jgi:poly(A) polymerase